jgi:hypothetical protein
MLFIRLIRNSSSGAQVYRSGASRKSAQPQWVLRSRIKGFWAILFAWFTDEAFNVFEPASERLAARP